ncbi:MAG TPA: hypothetical protein VH681_00960 [Nitrospiraceae bacterium]
MYPMNIESLVFVIVIGVAAGWPMKPVARRTVWLGKLTGRLISGVRGAIGGVSSCDVSFFGTIPSSVIPLSKGPGTFGRMVLARGRPLIRSRSVWRFYMAALR